MMNLATGGGTGDSEQGIVGIGHYSEPWYNKGDLGTGELVVMPEFFQTVDDVVRHYGGWSGVENEIPGEMRSDFSAAYTFLSTWGLEYANFLVSKAPVPPNVKVAITAGLFLIGVCKALKEVKEKRDTMIKNLTAGGMSPQLAEAEANKMVDGWLLEEVGKIVIETAIGTTMNQIGLKPYQQSTIVAAWGAFVDKVESGI